MLTTHVSIAKKSDDGVPMELQIYDQVGTPLNPICNWETVTILIRNKNNRTSTIVQKLTPPYSNIQRLRKVGILGHIMTTSENIIDEINDILIKETHRGIKLSENTWKLRRRSKTPTNALLFAWR